MNVTFQKTPELIVDVEAVNVEAPTAAVDVAPVATAPTVTALAPAASVVSPFNDDDIGFNDVILPRVNIVQKVGPLSNVFNGGEIVLNQSLVIHEPAKILDGKVVADGSGPLNIIVLGFRKRQFAEKVIGGKLGMLANSEAEVERTGGTLDYKTWKASEEAAKQPGGKPALRYFQDLATAFLLIEKPAHVVDTDNIEFSYEFGGKFYALALYSMKGIGFTNGAKVLFTARKLGYLRSGYTAHTLSLSTKLEKYDTGDAYIPVIKPGVKNSEELRKFAREILAPTS